MTASNVDALQAMLDEFVKETSPDFDRIDFLNCLVRAYGEVTTFNEEIQHHFDAPEPSGMGLMRKHAGSPRHQFSDLLASYE